MIADNFFNEVSVNHELSPPRPSLSRWGTPPRGAMMGNVLPILNNHFNIPLFLVRYSSVQKNFNIPLFNVQCSLVLISKPLVQYHRFLSSKLSLFVK
jgi:hypothetical protein